MMHSLIHLKDISLSFLDKNCFENFSSTIYPGNRIAIIGRNGSGKSSLLNILSKKFTDFDGELIFPDNITIGYIEQIITDYNHLSGAQRFNKKLSQVLALSPEVLILDEPTNHLDSSNRKSLIRMLKNYQGTLIIVSHDTDLLNQCTNVIWHINDSKVHEFYGSYNHYISQIKQKKISIEKELLLLERKKKDMHKNLMKEQKRAAVSKAKGKKNVKQKKWPTVVSHIKAQRANQTSGEKTSFIKHKKQHLAEQISNLKLPESITPKFSLNSSDIDTGNILAINNADIGYSKDNMLLKNLNLTLSGKGRIAICGKNASGKSTLLKAILDQPHIYKTGTWHLPKNYHIGYLDQHYANLDPKLSVLEHVHQIQPKWDDAKVRRHLNDFLFRKNKEVSNLIKNLSGGEKARLSLGLIAAKTPKLLILDEVTNNLDIETKQHMIEVLQQYPGAIIIVSHQNDFLQQIKVNDIYKIKDNLLSKENIY